MCRALSVLLTIIVFIHGSASALPTDSEQTLHIIADSSEFNYKTGKDIYEGGVKIEQGTTLLTADRLITQKNAKRKIKSAIAYGIKNLAELITTPKTGDQPLRAKARVIKYYPLTSTVILEDEVVVTQGENSFQGAIIIYNMKDQIVSVPASKNGRATIVIHPKQLKS